MSRHAPSLEAFLAQHRALLGTGPIALIFVEDDTEVAATLRHHIAQGFRHVLALMPPQIALPRDLEQDVWRIDYATHSDDDVPRAVNAVIAAAPGVWLFYCYNAEFLFFPFCETRTIGEMLAFHTEERRDAMLSYVVDLYASDLDATPNAVSLADAHLDRSGYYALARDGADGPKERQLDFFGGLRWRFEEHVPAAKRKIDRISLFRAKPGLHLRADHTFDDKEYNTFACPWHNNLTAAICSFRTAKALRTNPGSRAQITSFTWHNSTPFEWTSKQLLDLGLMESGQWF